MIGTRMSNSDIWLFLEGDEAARLETKTISGTFINLRSGKQGELEICLTQELNDELAKAKAKLDGMDIVHMTVKVYHRKYETIRSRGCFCDHQSYRHVNIIDTTSENFSDGTFYRQLKMASKT